MDNGLGIINMVNNGLGDMREEGMGFSFSNSSFYFEFYRNRRESLIFFDNN